LQEIRNDIGGRFGHEAALNAISMLQRDACGSIAIVDDNKLRLHFAAEIAGTALLKHLPNNDVKEFEAFLRDCLTEGYEHATNCVYILVREYLWERFRSWGQALRQRDMESFTPGNQYKQLKVKCYFGYPPAPALPSRRYPQPGSRVDRRPDQKALNKGQNLQGFHLDLSRRLVG
jgi:hypothetical protein